MYNYLEYSKTWPYLHQIWVVPTSRVVMGMMVGRIQCLDLLRFLGRIQCLDPVQGQRTKALQQCLLKFNGHMHSLGSLGDADCDLVGLVGLEICIPN